MVKSGVLMNAHKWFAGFQRQRQHNLTVFPAAYWNNYHFPYLVICLTSAFKGRSGAHGGDAQACAFIELSSDATDAPDRFGVGLDHNILTASIKALVSGVNRLGLVPKVAVKVEAALV